MGLQIPGNYKKIVNYGVSIKKISSYQNFIVKDGNLAGMGAHSYSKGTSTSGSEEATKYTK